MIKHTKNKKEGSIEIQVTKAPGVKCPRCWKYTEDNNYDNLCDRCFSVVISNGEIQEVLEYERNLLTKATEIIYLFENNCFVERCLYETALTARMFVMAKVNALKGVDDLKQGILWLVRNHHTDVLNLDFIKTFDFLNNNISGLKKEDLEKLLSFDPNDF